MVLKEKSIWEFWLFWQWLFFLFFKKTNKTKQKTFLMRSCLATRPTRDRSDSSACVFFFLHPLFLIVSAHKFSRNAALLRSTSANHDSRLKERTPECDRRRNANQTRKKSAFLKKNKKPLAAGRSVPTSSDLREHVQKLFATQSDVPGQNGFDREFLVKKKTDKNEWELRSFHCSLLCLLGSISNAFRQKSIASRTLALHAWASMHEKTVTPIFCHVNLVV